MCGLKSSPRTPKQNTWSAWTAAQSSNPTNYRNPRPASTNRCRTRSGAIHTSGKAFTTEGAENTEKFEGAPKRGGSPITIYDPQDTGHGSRLLLDSKLPDDPRHVRGGNVIQRAFVFLFELLPQILRGDVTGFSIGEAASRAGGKLHETRV